MTDRPQIPVALGGASGRMGKALIRALRDADRFSLSGGLVRPDSSVSGRDLGAIAGLEPLGVSASIKADRAFAGAAVVVDFSLAAAAGVITGYCADHGVPLVTGVTGRSAAQEAQLRDAAARIPVVAAANMSVGVNLLLGLTRHAAAVLSDYDAEILEVHHRHKIDAPSGTALAIGRAVADARGADQPVEMGRRPGDGARRPGAIGYASVRAGDVVGEHTLLLAGSGERIELTHRVTDRAAFAAGALRAAAWVVDQEPGLYGMDSVLAAEQAERA